jgi:hypothetical protein
MFKTTLLANAFSVESYVACGVGALRVEILSGLIQPVLVLKVRRHLVAPRITLRSRNASVDSVRVIKDPASLATSHPIPSCLPPSKRITIPVSACLRSALRRHQPRVDQLPDQLRQLLCHLPLPT